MSIFKRSEKVSSTGGSKVPKGSPDEIISLLVHQSNILYGRGDLDGAMKLLKKAEGMIRELGDQEMALKVQKMSEIIEFKKGL